MASLQKYWGQLESLGLPDGISCTWDNDRPEMQRGNGLTEEEFDRLSNEYTWFGEISCREDTNGHIHFTFNTEGAYCLFYWDQDCGFESEGPDIVFNGPLPELVKYCVEGYLAVRVIAVSYTHLTLPTIYSV